MTNTTNHLVFIYSNIISNVNSNIISNVIFDVISDVISDKISNIISDVISDKIHTFYLFADFELDFASNGLIQKKKHGVE